MKTYLILLSSILLAASGCKTMQRNVVVSSASTLGLSVAENPTTGLYEAKLGYARGEFASVPGNTNTPAAVPDVLMESSIQNIFKGGNIYQRVAIGSAAVIQPGATLMFGKDASGTLQSNVAAIISATPSPAATVTAAKLPLAQSYAAAADKNAWDTVAVANGYTSFSSFLTSTAVTLDGVTTMRNSLKAANLVQ